MIRVELVDLASTERVRVDLDRLPIAFNRVQLPIVSNGDAPLRHGVLLRDLHVGCAPVSGKRALVLLHALHLDAVRHVILVLRQRPFDALHPSHVAAVLRDSATRGAGVGTRATFTRALGGAELEGAEVVLRVAAAMLRGVRVEWWELSLIHI